MSSITVSQMVRALHQEPRGQCEWEKDAMTRCFNDSHCGLKPYLLSTKQVELIATIFRRLYHA